MSSLTQADRLRGTLWGLFVGDALAMPAHWYYDIAALQRDCGTIRDYQAPNAHHPSSMMGLASTGQAGRGDQEGEIVGRVILHGKKPFWGLRPPKQRNVGDKRNGKSGGKCSLANSLARGILPRLVCSLPLFESSPISIRPSAVHLSNTRVTCATSESCCFSSGSPQWAKTASID